MELQPPIPLEGGGFIFTIVLQRPLLIPVMVQLQYTDASNPERQATFQPPSTFFNTMSISINAFQSQVPFDSFFLGVSLVYMDIEGPVVQSVDAFSESLSLYACSHIKSEPTCRLTVVSDQDFP